MASEASAVFVAVRVRPLQTREDPVSCSVVVHDDTTISTVDVTSLLSSSSVSTHGRDGGNSCVSSSHNASPTTTTNNNYYSIANSSSSNGYGGNCNDNNSLSSNGLFSHSACGIVATFDGAGGDGAGFTGGSLIHSMGTGASSPARHTFSVDKIFWSVPSSVLPIAVTDFGADIPSSNSSYNSGSNNNPNDAHLGSSGVSRAGGLPKPSFLSTPATTAVGTSSSLTTARRLGNMGSTGSAALYHYNRNLPCFAPAPAYDSQASVYACLGPRLYEAAMQGFNTCLFAYGQTGSGKTHSMIGPPDQRLLLRMCSRVTHRIPKPDVMHNTSNTSAAMNGNDGKSSQDGHVAGVTANGASLTCDSDTSTSVDGQFNDSEHVVETCSGNSANDYLPPRSCEDSSSAIATTATTTRRSANNRCVTAPAAAGDVAHDGASGPDERAAGAGDREDARDTEGRTSRVPRSNHHGNNDRHISMRTTEECEDDEEGLGVMPRLCRDLFDGMHREREADASVSHNVEVSFFEIYCEKVRDLLAGVHANATSNSISHTNDTATGSMSSSAAPLSSSHSVTGASMSDIHNTSASHLNHGHHGNAGSGTNAPVSLRVRQHPTRGSYVEGLRHLQVKSTGDVMRCLLVGLRDRATAETRMNEHSSRSHAIMQLRLVRVTVVSEENGVVTKTRECKMSMVDLAGSERVSQSGATGERFEETRNINLSLSTLGRVIQQLSEKQAGKHVVPAYRDSVLTWLLADSLGGNSKTTMLATVAPSAYCYQQTINTLRFAGVTKRIINVATVHEDRHFQQLIAELRQQIVRLTLKLESGKMSVKHEAQWEAVQAEKAHLQQQNGALLAKLAHVADESVLHALRMRVSELEEENGTLRGELATLQQCMRSTTHSLHSELADRDGELQRTREQLSTTQGQVHHWMRCARDALQASVRDSGGRGGSLCSATNANSICNSDYSNKASSRGGGVVAAEESIDGVYVPSRRTTSGVSNGPIPAERCVDTGGEVSPPHGDVRVSRNAVTPPSKVRPRARNRPPTSAHSIHGSNHSAGTGGSGTSHTRCNHTIRGSLAAKTAPQDDHADDTPFHDAGGGRRDADGSVDNYATRPGTKEEEEADTASLLGAGELCTEFADTVGNSTQRHHDVAVPLFDRALLSQQTRVIQRLRGKVQQLSQTLTQVRKSEREACEGARLMQTQLADRTSQLTMWQTKSRELEQQLRATAELLLSHACRDEPKASAEETENSVDAICADTHTGTAAAPAAQSQQRSPKEPSVPRADCPAAPQLIAQLRQAREECIAEKQVSIHLLLRASRMEEELTSLQETLHARVADSAELEHLLHEETETSERYYVRMRYYRALIALQQERLAEWAKVVHSHSCGRISRDGGTGAGDAEGVCATQQAPLCVRSDGNGCSKSRACTSDELWLLLRDQCAHAESEDRTRVQQMFLSERVDVLLRLVQRQREAMRRMTGTRARDTTPSSAPAHESRFTDSAVPHHVRTSDDEDDENNRRAEGYASADGDYATEQTVESAVVAGDVSELRHELQTIRRARDDAERALECLIARHAELQSVNDELKRQCMWASDGADRDGRGESAATATAATDNEVSWRDRCTIPEEKSLPIAPKRNEDVGAAGNSSGPDRVGDQHVHEMQVMLDRYRDEAVALRTRAAEADSAQQRTEQRHALLAHAHKELREMYDHAARSYELQLQERQAMNRTLQSALEEETNLADVTRLALQRAREELTALRDAATSREEEMTELRHTHTYLRNRHAEIQRQLDELVVQCGETAAGLRELRQGDRTKTYHVYELDDIHNSEAWLERAQEQKLALQQQKRDARRLNLELSQHARVQAERLRDVERQLSVVFSRSGFAGSAMAAETRPGRQGILSRDEAAVQLGVGSVAIASTSNASTNDSLCLDTDEHTLERVVPVANWSELDDKSLDLTAQYENVLSQTNLSMNDELSTTPFPDPRTRNPR